MTVDCSGSKAIMLLPVQSQARFWKRINSLQRLGVSTKVFSFERDYYEGQSSRREWVSLGALPHGKYLRRIPALLNAASTVYQRPMSMCCMRSGSICRRIVDRCPEIALACSTRYRSR